MSFLIYIIYSFSNKSNRTYVGYTNNINKRLRQHNGICKGGAKYTRGRNWQILCTLEGFDNKRHAMQLEWALHRKYPSINNKDRLYCRLKRLNYYLNEEKWTKNAPESKSFKLMLRWHNKENMDKYVTMFTWPINITHLYT